MRMVRYIAGVLFLLFLVPLSVPFTRGNDPADGLSLGPMTDPEGQLDLMGPSYFVENRGQWDESLLFVGETPFGHIGLGRDCIYFHVIERAGLPIQVDAPDPQGEMRAPLPAEQVSGFVIRYCLEGSDAVQVRGEGELSHRTNYFIGNDWTRWVTGARSYERVVYEDLWKDVDMVLRFGAEGPKYDIFLGDGACIEDVRIRVEGHEAISIQATELNIDCSGPFSIRDTGLIAYEATGGGDVNIGYRMYSGDTFGFSIPDIAKGTPVVIDPLVVATYLGGGNMDYCYSTGVDVDGNIILFGWTYSSDFPTTPGVIDTTLGGTGDICVSMLDWSGTELLFSTYLGGSGYDYYYYYGGMAVMDDGILVSCITSSNDYPTTADCFDGTLTGSYDAAFSKLSLDGSSLLISSYFGGSSYEYVYDVAGSSDGGFYLLGSTYSSDLPVTSGAFQGSLVGTSDCFVASFSSDGRSLKAMTYFGGSSADYPQRVREDQNGDIVVSGSAYSSDFPVSPGCYDTSHNGGTGDCFVSVVQGDGKALLASTFLGSSGSDVPHGMTIDQEGNVLLFGFTTSSAFPVTAGSFQGTYAGGGDAFIAVMDIGLKGLLRSTFFGGSGDDSPVSIGVDPMGNVVIAGSTVSSNMPTTPDAEDSTINGGQDFFLGILTGDLSELSYSTYWGGSGGESGGELTVDPLGKIVVGGRTNSTNMPVTDKAYQKDKKGSLYYSDSYVFGIEHFTASEPLSVDSVKTYSDGNFTVETRRFDIGDRVYIELRGVDSNTSRRDGATVNVSSVMAGTDLFYRVLVETQKDSGIFRGQITVPQSSRYLDRLRVQSRKDPSKRVDVLIDYPFRPSFVSSLTAHEDAYSTVPLEKADLGQMVFFKAFGLDANPLTRDKAFVNITSDRDPPLSLLVVLLETDATSGLYQGVFQVPATLDYFENITASSVETPGTFVVLMVHTPVKLRCDIDHTSAVEDSLYEAIFWNFGYMPVSWSVTENAYWLSWDPDGKRLHGTPSNIEVGETEATVSIWDEEGHSDNWTFIIDVKNVPPRVLTENVLTALEDSEYSVRYESDDDIGGRTSWFLTTNAPFLSLNRNTGELKGRPINDDVGSYFVGIDVQDGNGGTTGLRFNLTVLNTNDRPIITTVDIKTVLQDERLVRDYEAMDEDLNDTMLWELRTDALWLTLDNLTGLLTGEPEADDVGRYRVNVTVVDTGGLFDSRDFTLEVLDVKDRPSFVDIPAYTEVLHGRRFLFDVNATDPDQGDTLEYSISKCDPPSDITIDPETGQIDWVASIHFLTDGKDRYRVTLKVSDGELFSNAEFELKVIPTLSPSSTITSPSDGHRTPSGYALLTWEGSDPEDDDLTYTVYLHQTSSEVSQRSDDAVHARDISGRSLNITGLDQGATYHWTVVPYDGGTFGTCTNGILSFRVNNRPVLEQMDRRTARVGTTFRVQVRGSDLDGEDTLVHSLLSAPDGMRMDGSTGAITWAPDSSQVGEHTVRIRVTDGLESTDMSFYVEVEEGGGLDPTVLMVIAGFSILIFIIIVLVLFIVLRVRKMSPDIEKEGKKDESDQIAREIEELRKERGWEDEHATGEGESKAVTISLESAPPVPTSPLEAHLHDKDRAKPTYEDLYGPKAPEESEEQIDKVLKEGLEEMEEEDEEESWE